MGILQAVGLAYQGKMRSLQDMANEFEADCPK
jgi:hypothetical protein